MYELSPLSCSMATARESDFEIVSGTGTEQNDSDSLQGLAQMHKVARVLFDGEALGNEDATLKRYAPEELACLKYSPMTSCDVERSFSMLTRR